MPCAGYMPQPTLHHTPYPRQPSPLAPHTPHPHPLAASSLSPMPHSHSTCYVGAPPVASLAITFPPSPPSTPSLPPPCLSSLPLFLTTISRLPLPPSTLRPCRPLLATAPWAPCIAWPLLLTAPAVGASRDGLGGSLPQGSSGHAAQARQLSAERVHLHCPRQPQPCASGQRAFIASILRVSRAGHASPHKSQARVLRLAHQSRSCHADRTC